ncbi:hypothetical protein [uncultured Maribacter sp.]|uniref:hypothetical protein n=1 Tax=uncultured Maribacter sp. TaxID=431308 RepID=UPI0026106361|nr:hypothetical protein [uncultured Maribacter sp.]
MKLIVLGMMKCNILLLLALFLYVNPLDAQLKYEKEHRIRKTQFPEHALIFIQKNITNAKRLKYYKEIDGSKTQFELKLKKDRLWYNIEFTEEGNFKNIEIEIQNVDVLDESYTQITTYLEQKFSSYKIKKIKQQYSADQEETEILNTAFQNLITPEIKYNLIVRGKKDSNSFEEFNILFNAKGNYISSRKSLPPNYDHTLY